MKRNKLLLFLVIFIVIAVLALIFNISSNDDSDKSMSLKGSNATEEKQITDAERDTYVNTISTINERNRQLETRLNALEQQQQNKDSDQMVADLVDQKIDERSKGIFEGYQKKFNDLVGGLPGIGSTDSKKQYQENKSFNPSPSNIPEGLGFDSLLNPGKKDKNGFKETSDKPLTANELKGYQSDQLVTITPFTQVAYSNDDKEPVPVTITGQPIRDEVDPLTVRNNKSSEDDDKGKSIPFYTIPRNATLFSNTTLTALLGIVPNEEGSLLDPIRFKLITGQQNLASNGHFIPGIRDIVWSGIAIGNREMSCVRGEVHSVTFTFDDGRVYTQSSTRDGDTKTTNIRKILGYISDTRGKPCLTGQLITNAQDYLKDRMIAAGVGATADSFAQTQETTTVSEGVSETFFSGDQGDFIAASTLSGSLKELTDYLRDRQRNAVDLVYLDGGQDVVLHVEDEITIDYLTKGRKLDYASQIPTQQNTAVSFFD
jgi:integrating conjugative element protein (TIGR03752 family)